jgi:hypothetical protein
MVARETKGMTMTYGDKRDYRKIDIYHDRHGYVCSTTWAKTCREAIDRFIEARKLTNEYKASYSARFAKR